MVAVEHPVAVEQQRRPRQLPWQLVLRSHEVCGDADVDEPAGLLDPAQQALRRQVRQHVGFERALRPQPLDHTPVEHVDPGVDQARPRTRLAGFRARPERVEASVLPQGGDAIARRVGDLPQHQRAERPGGQGGQRRTEHAVEPGIAIDQQKALIEQRRRMVQCAAGPGPHRLAADPHPQGPRQAREQVGQSRLDHVGQVAGQQDDVIDAEPADLLQQPGQERPPGHRQHRLRHVGCQRADPGAQAADQHHALPDPLGSVCLAPRQAATRSALTAPRAPGSTSGPVVVSRAVWCSISAFSSPPTSTIDRGDPDPGHEADRRAERAVGLVVAAEIGDVPGERERADDPGTAANAPPQLTQRQRARSRLGPKR